MPLNLSPKKDIQSWSDSQLLSVWTVLMTCSLQGSELFITNLGPSSVTKHLGKYFWHKEVKTDKNNAIPLKKEINKPNNLP